MRRPPSRALRDDQDIPPSFGAESRGMVVVSKPSGWEVDGATTDFNTFIGQRLSAFLQSRFPPETNPLSYDEHFEHGFIHRLDVPSSGLILAGTTYEGLYSIRWQLNSHGIHREYFIVSHGKVCPGVRCIRGRIDIRAALTNECATISPRGKPARTHVKAVAHAPWTGPGACAASLTAVRIHTGRRHQIRVHVQYCGHAPVADGRYPIQLVLIVHCPAAPAP
mmetsp:Transcript_10346/g.29226  ORF Transcript_10346/g.29226 Transcript_10346/m.29226 type:complete len:222 (-) Transcript_10346:73-738(-)